jgi:hypothetical protein
MTPQTTPAYNPNAAYNAGVNATAPATGTPASSPINISTLNGAQSPLNVQQPTTSTPFNLATLPQQQLTDTQQQAQDLSTSMESLNNKLAQRNTDTSSLFQQYGYGTSLDANGNLAPNDPSINEMNTQIAALTNHQKDLQNQAAPGGAIQNTEQQNAFGRGITAAGLAPLSSADLRNNQIQQSTIASQALSLSSLVAAKQGNLAYATQLVNNAIQQKYGPMEAQLNAQKANLALVQNSPQASLDEKRQAAQMQLSIDAQSQSLALQKQNNQNAQTAALDYTTVATPQQLQQLQSAQSPGQVAMLAQQMHLVTPQQQQALLNLQNTANALKQAPTDLALKQAQLQQAIAVANAYKNPNLINAIQQGNINPAAINSRTLPFYSTLYNSLPNLNSVQANAAADFYESTGTQTKLAWAATTEKDFNTLRTLSAAVPRTSLPAVNAALLKGETSIKGDPNATSFLQAANRVAASLGNVLGDSGGSDFRTKLANGVLDPSFSPQTFDKVLSTESSLINNLTTSFQQQGNQPITGTQAADTHPTQNNAPAPSSPKNGDTYTYNGKQYKVVNGSWVAQ